MTLPKSMERVTLKKATETVFFQIGWLNDAASQTCQYSRFDYDGESEFLQDFMSLFDWHLLLSLSFQSSENVAID